MKKLYLVRHAKSSWDSPDMDDFNRPLNNRGEKDAPHMAKILKRRGVVPDRMISSPAVRALKTCKEFAKVLHFEKHKIGTIEKLYHASADTWLKVLQLLDEHPGDDEDVALVFGHNPGITEFANQLLNVSIDNIPTCGIVSATLDIDEWKKISYGCGKLDAFDYPKMDQ
ncbi:MAG TPA: phosphohistidine phosphatase [Cytophagales bacterium]|jgi:phosphohistidine phosphatase|nr:phosphohistidine phosphatase [Cytophagales bacterium]